MTNDKGLGAAVSLDDWEDARPMRLDPTRTRAPLSPMQRRLWLVDQVIVGTALHNVPWAWVLSPGADPARVHEAIEAIVLRHVALRTQFTLDADGEPVQCLVDRPVELTSIDVVPATSHAMRERAEAFSREPIAWDAPRPWRVALLRAGEAGCWLVFSAHHLIVDGWSIGLLRQAFDDAMAGVTPGDGPATASPFDLACWTADAGSDTGASLDWWQERLRDVSAVDLSRTRASRAAVVAGDVLHFELPRGTTAAMDAYCRAERCTPFMVLLAAYAVVLYRYTGTSIMAVGTPVTRRDRSELLGTVGCFVDTVVRRVAVDADTIFADVVRGIRDDLLLSYAHEHVPLEEIVHRMQPVRDATRSPLFQVMLSVSHAGAGGGSAHVIETIPLPTGTAKVDLSLTVLMPADATHEPAAVLEFAKDLLDARQVEGFSWHFSRVLADAVVAPDTRIGAISMLPDDELARLHQLSATGESAPPRATIVDRFREAAARDGSAIAVRRGDDTLNYATLDLASTAFASRLIDAGVTRGSRVCVLAAREVETIVAVLGVLKVAAVYVPMDPALPVRRLEAIVASARPSALASAHAPAFATDHVPVLWPRPGDDAQVPVSASAPGTRDLAYMIHTSGSTGVPKGVVVTHEGLARYLTSADSLYRRREGRVLLHSPFGFDLSITNLFLPLARGDTIELLGEDASLDDLADALRTGAYDVVKMTPSHLEALQPLLDRPGTSLRLGSLVIGGEALGEATLRWWRAAAAGVEITNEYGPTEAVVGCCAYDASAAGEATDVPIGAALPGVRLYVLDRAGERAPYGVPGELYIGGDGLALGYHARPGATACAFLPDPFADVPGARMYRTGDRVRYLDDGALVFLGRVDRQLKIRGYRIEPGEIEAVLRGHPEVRLAAVFPRERSTGTQLVACVAADPRPGLIEALHDWLACRLPAFQIPSLIVALPELPLTTNGKIDRARLPERSADESAAPPASGTEVRLHGIWCELLGGEAIDRQADFFSLGGHSLLATRMVAQVRSEFAVDVEVRAFFEAPSIAGFARRIDTAAAITAAGLSAWPRADVDAYGEVAASLAQGRIFLVDRVAPGDVSYNVPVAVGLRGDVRVDALQAALDGLLARHDVLRSGLRERAAEIRSFVVEAANVPIITESCPVSGMTERARAFSSMPFDLGTPPLIRGLLLDHGDRHATLVLCFHHAVIDGWSMPIVWRDLGKLHDAWLQGTRLVLPAPAIRYADYASWQRAHPQRALVSMERWLERLAGVEPLALPYDAVPGISLETLVQPRVLALPPGLATRVRDFARACGTTPFTVLLATFKVLMARYADTDDVAVLVPVANRSMPQTQDLVGFFVNTVILRTKLGGTPGFTDTVRRVQATCRDAIADEDLPFDALVERLGTARAGNGPAAFPAMFAFHDTRAGGPSFAGLLAEPVELHNGSTKHPLTFNLTDAGSDMVLQVEYAATYFHAATIQRMAVRFVTLLDAALDAPSECVWDLDFDAQESEEAVGQCDDDLIQAIDAIARERGSAVALRSTAGTLTYRDLADRTWRLAAYLRASGATPGKAVGLCVPRSNDMIVALLAILRTGAHYVPIDPELPAERLARIVGDADVALVVTQWSSRPALAPSVEVVLLDLDKDAIAACDPMDVRVDIADDELAYIIPTSGSTGVPKGVMITRGGLAAYARWAADAYGAADSVLHTPLSFDLSLTSIVVPLLGGATITLLDHDADLDGLAAALRAAPRPVLLKATPAHLGGLALLSDPATARRGVGTLVVGGEMLHNDLVRAWRDDAPATRIANEYGPTETVVGCSVHWVTGEESTASVPIGHPAAGALLYVLDSRGRRSAKGTIGELHIGGPAVARGYARRPDLTAERFLPDPFAARPGQRMYRTGDRVRVGDDGSLEYLGRTDRQLKIRGYRIEPAEIEAALLSHASVAEVLVMAGGDEGARSLIAFVVLAPGVREVAVLPLVEHLRKRLPRYALPSRICPVDAMPLTANGKVDQASLLARMQREERPSAATTSTPTQSLLAGIWTEVLGEDRAFGIHDDFFDLGGHSLLATRVVSRVRQAFGVELSLRSVFEEPTIAGMARRVDEALRGSDRAEVGVVPVPRTGLLPVSYAQQRLWFLAGLEPDSIAYHVPLGWSLDGTIDESALGRALDDLVARHEVLRTRVVVVGEEPMQVVEEHARLPLSRVEVADADAADAWMREAIRKRFDLSSGPLIRAWLVSLPDATHRLLLSMHHIVVDNWAVGVLLDELAVLYRGHRAGTEPALPALAVQYADYASWQRRWMDSAASARQLSYWRTQLSGLEPLSLPTDRPRPAVQGSRGATWTFRVPAELSRGLSRLSRREGATLFMTLLAGFQVVLGRYAGTRDVAIGSPVANRNRAEVEGLIGFFVNTVVLRTDLGGSPGFAELVRRVRQVCLDAYAHQELPFEKLVEELQPERDLSRTPLFQVLFALQNAHTSDVSLEGVSCTALELGTDTSKFDLNLSMQEHGEGIEAAIEYNPDLFDAMTVERLSGHYLTVLAAAVDEPERDIDSLPLMDAAERSWLSAWNRSDVAVAEEGLLAKLSRWSRERPGSMAVREGERTLDFAGLDRATAQVARALVARGVGVEDRVGLWLERSVEQLVALLGVLRAGAAYVPLDPSLPSRRLEAMARTAAVTLVIGGDTPLAALPWLPVAQACAYAGDEALPEAMAPASLAYVMFTSGSTGEPKGTMVTRGGLDNYLGFAGERYLSSWQGGEGSVVHSSLGFDLTVTSLLAPLAAGHGVRLLAGGAQVDGLVDALREEGARLGLLKLTPAHLEVLEQALGEAGPRARVGTLVIGGEALHESRLRYWRRHAPQTRLINEYGPTETVVGCSVYEASEASAENAAVPIGRPLANLRLHVLDASMQAVPAGVPGEVYIGGAGVARGYTGRPDLTAERFVPDPFAGHPGERLYRTGDRARRRADGELEYLGRLDEQLKLRGYRLEPGEVEAALVALPGIAQAAVGVHRRADGLGNLVAWYVGVDGVESSADALREALRGWLPEHAIPVHYRRLDALPLTVNGKLDRQALPAPSDDELARPLVAPRTAVESRLSDIWAQAEVLGVDQLGIHDDFFDLGGHSLLATRVVSRVRQAFDVELPLRSIFEEPTIAGMARRVEEALGGGDRAEAGVIPMPREDPLPLSYAQQRLWFLAGLEPDSVAYNVPFAWSLDGELDEPALQRSLDHLVRRHEVLRSRVIAHGDEPMQIVDAVMSLPLRRVEVADADAADAWMREAIRKRFDLSSGPLIRAWLVSLPDATHRLLLSMHHIVVDNWAVGVLLDELAVLYRGHRAGTEPALPALAVQYADYASWQRRWMDSAASARQLSYWRTQLSGLEPLSLPTDRPRPAVQGSRGATWTFRVPAELSRGLSRLSRREGATLFMTLLAGFQVVLGRYAGTRDVAIGSPVANRNRAEVEGLIGFFVNTVVLRTDLGGSPGFAELVRRVRQVCLDAYAHQELPFEKLVEELQPERDLSRTPLFQVLFALQNAHTSDVSLEGVSCTALELGTDTSKFDLNLSMQEHGEGIEAAIEYNPDLFDAMTVERLSGHYLTVLAAAVDEPERDIDSLPLMDAAERSWLSAWNRSDVAVAEEGLLAKLSRWSRERPGSMAVREGERTLDFAGLDRATAQVARALVARGVGVEDRVGLWLERSVEQLVALLGVLRAGAAYVPLDPSLPSRRLEAMARTAAVTLVIGGDTPLAALPWLPVAQACAYAGDEALPEAMAPASLAYVMFTSGSTGEPKGTMVTRGGLDNYLGFAGERYLSSWQGGEGSVVHSSLGFDLTVTSLLAPLAAGHGVRLLAGGAQVDGLVDALREEGARLGLLKLTPAHLEVLEQALGEAGPRARVGTLVIGGEALHESRLRYWRRHAPQTRLINEYGPTETVVGCSVYEASEASAENAAVPIGRPLANLRLHVLDASMQAVPAGVPGEVYIGGAGVARGYTGRPDLTAERFVPDPFAGHPGERLYRTGDRARRRADGELEYLGRLDEQLKLRGYRLEPGEVEAALVALPGIAQAAVGVHRRADGLGNLVAWYVGVDGVESSADALREALRGWLPEHAIPVHYRRLDALPLTVNGKLDRQALPAPSDDELARPLVAPRTAVESRLSDIWAQAEVLGVDQLGIHDDFFDLGGHSLLATRVVSRVRQAFDVELPLRSIFEEPTIAGMARRVEEALGGGDRATRGSIVTVDRKLPLPLSYAQQRLWFLHRMDPESGAYSVPLGMELVGPLDVEAMDASIVALGRRHEVLRTRFEEIDGTPFQRIDDAAMPALVFVDLSSLPDPDAAVTLATRENMATRFDLRQGPLLRAHLYRLAEERHQLVFTMHHIVLDGWSVGILLRELDALYRAAVTGSAAGLPPLAVQYADFAAWQRDESHGPALDAQRMYWRAQLAGLSTLELPTSRPRPALRSGRGVAEPFSVPNDVVAGVRRLGRREGATLFMGMLAGFVATLHRYASADEVAVGSPVAGRDRTEIEGLIGFFVNTLVLRTDLRGKPDARELLARVRKVCVDAFANQEVPFERLVEDIQPERDLGRSPLFQVMFSLNDVNGSNDTFAAFDTRYLPLHNDTAKFDLNMHLDEKAGSVGGILEYDSDLFDAAWIRAFIGHFHAILRAMVDEPEIAIAHMPMLSVEERAHLASVNARHEVVEPRSALDAFEATAKIQPAGIAVVAGDASVAYAALDERAARLAGHLVSEGVKAGDIVGVHLERGIDFIVSLLAVWKAGAGFVALDPAWPASRLAYITADTGLSHVISQWRTRQPLGARVTCEVFLDLDEAAVAATAPHAGTPVPPSALAYVMYTSGSTGQPKGVMVPHVALGNYLAAAAEYTQGTAAGWTVAHSPTGFDLGLTSMLLPLSQGGRVVLAAPGDELDTLVAAILARRPRGMLKVTPSHLPVLVERLAGHDLEGALDCLVIGGEALTESSLDPVRQLLRGVRVVNEYGPTEATIGCVAADVSASSGTGPAPIGGPIAQTTLYVLDAHMERVPFGVPGDIHLGGMSLAHGYLGRPDLTAERFVPDPYSPIPGARLYRTGDLGVYAPDGMLRYLGRRDEQLKVRGYRIEPEQVVAAIRGLPSVRHAAVYADIDTAGVARLCAAVVPRDGAGFDLESLKRHLADLLPAHEVPQGFSIVESLPLTDNGKLDRAALRRAVEAPVTPERALRIADDTVLTLLAGIWSDVLGSEVDDPLAGFFDLGGHSLLATRVAARTRQVFGVELALRAIFTRPTLAGMADAVREAMRATTGSVLRPLRPVDHGTVSPALSFAQARLWFLQQMAPESVQYNMPFALELQGDIDVQALEEALTLLTERHASLRTVFGTVDDEPVQCVLPMTRLVIDTRHVESDDELTTLVERAARRPFDLAHGPLLRAALYLRPGNRQVLLLSMHHIVADGWSVGVLMRDLGHFYAIATGRPSVALPALPVTYADYASWHAAWLGDAAYDVQARYWTRQLDGLRPLDMPLDRPRKAMQGTEGGVISFAIPAELAVRLRRLAREGGATLFMTLLAAFDIVLSRHARTEDVAVGTFVANRSLPEVQDVVGLFVNTLVLRVDVGGSPTFRQLLERVREVSLDAYSHQDMPFEKLVEVLAPERDLSVSPMFGILFQVQDETLGAGTLGDLTYTPYPVAVATSKFDLHVAIAADGDGLAGAIEYALDLFDAPTVERLGAHLVRVLECVADAPDAAIDAIALADASDETWLDARNTSTTLLASEDGIRGRDLATRFEQRVRRQPTTVALRHGKLAIDFATLNARANRIAHHLRAQGVGPEGRVAICMERSFDLVATLLAVLKTGAAYVPIDAEYPPARIALMLEVSGASLLVTHRQHERTLAGKVPLLLLDADTVAIAARSAENLGVQVYPAQAAYVVFTSGSTGTPKGVVGLHGATLNRLDWMYREWPFQPGEVCCAKTSLGFVDSVWELLGPLLAGVPNVLVPSQQNYDAIGFMQTLQAEKVSRIVLVPSLLRTMLDVLPAGSRALNTLRICVTSGEAMAPDLAAQALERLPGCRLLNLYGASENGADVTWHDVSPDDATGAIPLGTPIDRTHVYVLDESLRRVPPGMIGEVHVASAGLARGYEGRSDLTAERFVPNPFSPEPGGRMYRTGDLGRYRPDGSLMFAGRTDQQVKLRGRRIELGEIENALRALQGVRAAAVRLHRATGDDVGGRIVAYVVADEVGVEGLREALAAGLPAYMLPSAWQLLDALPLTSSGKLDRRALAPPVERLASSVPGGSPRSDTEVRIAAIWARLLRIDSVGLDESFFDAGGHSLQLVKLRAEMQREFNVEISVVELFARPTVRALARLLGEGDGDVFHPGAIQRRAALRGSFYSQVNEEIGKGPSNEQA